MANKNGIITRKDIIEDEALTFGKTYADNLQTAITANGQLVASVKELNIQVQKFKTANSQKDYITAKQAEALATQEAINKIKKQEAAEISLEKIRKQAIITQKEEEALLAKKIQTEKTQISLQQQQEKLQKMQNNNSSENTRLAKLQTFANLSLAGSYDKISAQLSINLIKWKKLSEAERANTAEGKALTKEIANQEAALKKLDAQIGRNQRNVGNYGSAFKSIGSSIGSLMGAFGVVGGVTAFAAVATDIYDTTKEIQSLDLALKSVTGTQSEFLKQQSYLSGIADKYGLEINNLTKQYTAFYVAAKDKLAGSQIQQIFEDIARSGSALGLSNETLERSFQAVNQMLSKGTVASEELRGQLAESMPGAVQAMTRAVQKLHPEIKNLTEKGLFEMIKDGKILASEVLPETAKQLALITGADKAAGMDTLTKSTNRLSNEWVEFVRILNGSDVGSIFGNFFSTGTDIATSFLKTLKEIIATQSQLDKDAISSNAERGKTEFNRQFKNSTGSDADKAEFIKLKSQGAVDEIRKLSIELKKAEKQAELTILKSGGSYRALVQNVTDIKAKIGFQSGVNTGAKDAFKELNLSKKNNSSLETPEQKKAREKSAKDKLDLEKQLSDSLYELQKQRLERSIKINDEIAADEKNTDDIRIEALYRSQEKQEALTKLTKNHLLDNDKLVANDRIRIKEEASNKIIDIEKKTSEEVKKINEFDEGYYNDKIKREISEIEIANNEKLAKEEKRFQDELALGYDSDKAKEDAAKTHERNLFNIKKEGLIAITKLQIANLNAEIDAYEIKAKEDGKITQKESDFILAKRKEVSDLSVRLIQVEGEKFKENETDKGKTAKEQAEEILQISSEALGHLADLSNAFSEAKIQKIDEEIDKNNEYYDKQIELAGDDARQKDLLTQEKEKKNAELEKKKRKEQEKQAKFEKAVAIAQIAIQTALSVVKASPAIPLMIMAGVAGAIALATAIATPIPKYKDGRKGGKKEIAMINDGGVTEVVERKSGEVQMYSGKNRIVQLFEGDTVHKSVDDYAKLQRSAMMASIDMQGRKMSDFQANQYFESTYGKELVEEMKLTRKAIQNQKPTVLNAPKLDINHHLWKLGNTNWK
jgi:tape measure domain-containing protein